MGQLLAQIWQQVLLEPLPAELEVISFCGQKDQLPTSVHGGQAQSVLLTRHNYTFTKAMAGSTWGHCGPEVIMAWIHSSF